MHSLFYMFVNLGTVEFYGNAVTSFFQRCDVRLDASSVWQYIYVLAGWCGSDKLGNSECCYVQTGKQE